VTCKVRLAVGLSLALVIVRAGSLGAQTPPSGKVPAAGGGLDERLLEGLQGAAKAARPANSTAAEVIGLRGDSQDPVARIAEKMRAVQTRIAQHDTSSGTQAAQRQIVSELAALLEQAQQKPGASGKQGASGRGSEQARAGTGNPATGPPRDSANRIERGSSEQAKTADTKDLLRRIWGHLPDKLREQMQASLSEEFLPKYEQIIEDYYRRLAEEGRGLP